MNKRKHGKNGFVWQMPELEDELFQIFSVAGKITSIKRGMFSHWLHVKIELNKPAKVVNWRNEYGDGLAINSNTNAIFDLKNGVSPRVSELPKQGDMEITIGFHLELHTFDKNEVVTLDDLRSELKKLAEGMTRTWYYHF